MIATKTMKALLSTLGFEPARIVCPEALFRQAREAATEIVHLGDTPIQIRSHPLLPDNLMIVFGAEGSFEVVLLENQDEKCD